MSRFCNICMFETSDYQIIYKNRGTFLFHESEQLKNVYQIKEGFVKVIKYHEDGNEQILDILGPGDFLALLLVMQNKGEYSATAITLSEVTLHQFTVDAIMKTYKLNSNFQQTCLTCATSRLNVFQKHLVQIATHDVEEKILSVLSQLYHKFGSYKNHQHTLYLPITQTDLASIMGIRRETLSRKLSQLQKDGIIEINKNTYTLYQM